MLTAEQKQRIDELISIAYGDDSIEGRALRARCADRRNPMSGNEAEVIIVELSRKVGISSETVITLDNATEDDGHGPYDPVIELALEGSRDSAETFLQLFLSSRLTGSAHSFSEEHAY